MRENGVIEEGDLEEVVHEVLRKKEEKMEFKNWSDPKKFIFEDLVLYAGGFVFWAFYDLIRCRLDSNHPFSFGIIQVFFTLSFLGLFARKWEQWKYYR